MTEKVLRNKHECFKVPEPHDTNVKGNHAQLDPTEELDSVRLRSRNLFSL